MDRDETTVKGVLRCSFIEEEGGHQGLRSWTKRDYEDASIYMNRANNGASLLQLLIPMPILCKGK